VQRLVNSKVANVKEGLQTICLACLSFAQQQPEEEASGFFETLSIKWGLGPGKYLLVHYDEKWFWGMVCCRDANACEELGISPVTFAAYHKSHISKVMAMAVVGLAFEDSIDNGVEAMKLGFYHAQTFKVAQKLQRESVRQPDGSLKQNGPIKRRKGDNTRNSR
jgi:hypothetical protein